MARNPSCLVVNTLGFEGGAIASHPNPSSPQRLKMSRQRVSLHCMPICTRSHRRPPAPLSSILARDFMPQTQAGGVISAYVYQLRQLGVKHLELQLCRLRTRTTAMNLELQLMDVMRRSLGMVIPVWFPPSLTADQVRENLLVTLHGCEHFLPWDHVVLVVDGDVRSFPIVQELQESCRQRHGHAFDIIYCAENRGKGYAVFRGVQWFLEKQNLEYLTIRDADGDHTLNDLVNLMRLAVALQKEETYLLIIVGRRNHPHRALGWIRGEFEALLNRVLIDAVRFALARRQQVLNTQYFSLSDEYPDLHSGYKVYSRRVCELMVERTWERQPWVGPEIYRYGVEAVPFIEGVMAGAVVGEMTRLTKEPDFSSHGAFTRPETNGSVLLWTFLRLGIEPHQAATLLDNHLPRLTLWTDPQGRATLLELRQYVLERLLRSAQRSNTLCAFKPGSYF